MAKGRIKGQKKPLPINRAEKFFTGKDFRLEVQLGQEYLTDLGMTVLLFKVDYKKTKTHDLYGESKAKEKVVDKPVELQVKLLIEEGETKYLAPGGLKREFAGNLTFTVYEAELIEKKTNIQEGDFIGYVDGNSKIRYWEVFNAEQMNVSNSRTMVGKESYYRKIQCAPVDKDVFFG